MEHICNAINKVGARTYYCELPTGHEGEHESLDPVYGKSTWPQEDWR